MRHTGITRAEFYSVVNSAAASLSHFTWINMFYSAEIWWKLPRYIRETCDLILVFSGFDLRLQPRYINSNAQSLHWSSDVQLLKEVRTFTKSLFHDHKIQPFDHILSPFMHFTYLKSVPIISVSVVRTHRILVLPNGLFLPSDSSEQSSVCIVPLNLPHIIESKIFSSKICLQAPAISDLHSVYETIFTPANTRMYTVCAICNCNASLLVPRLPLIYNFSHYQSYCSDRTMLRPVQLC
jgi:hypothetical protein